MMHFVPIPTTHEHLRASSRHWLPFLEKISKRSHESVEEMLDQIAAGLVHLALVWNDETKTACALLGMQFRKNGDDLVGEIHWLTGRGMKEWRTLLPELKAYLKTHVGCTVIKPICRPGWEPYLKAEGFKKTHIMMEMRL